MKMDMLESLIMEQEKQGSSDQQFAAQLDCSRQLWQGTRTGAIPMGDTILKGTARAFPNLRRRALYMLVNLPNKNQAVKVAKVGLVETIKRTIARHQR